jgi:hypothetical protein
VHPFLAASVFWTLPLGITLASWMAAKFGARAALWLMFPFPVMVAHVNGYLTGGIEGMAKSAFDSMMTVPLALSWAIPYFHFCRVVDGRIGNRKLEAMLTFLLATGAAAVIQALYEPAWQALCAGPLVQMIAVYLIVAASFLLLRLPADEREPRDAMPTTASMMFRTLSVVTIVALVFLSAAASDTSRFAALLCAFLLVFPRMTFELTISTQVTNGVIAARQVLAGLPPCIVTITVWCYALMWIPKSLPDAVVVTLALLASMLTLGAWVLLYSRWWAPRPGWLWIEPRAAGVVGADTPA